MSIKHTVELTKDNIILIKLFGNQTVEDMAEVASLTESLAHEMAARHLPVLIALDLNQAGKQTAGARTSATKFLHLGYKRFAIFGGSKKISTLAQYIVKTMGFMRSAKYFKTEREARRWLLKGGEPKPHILIWGSAIVLSITSLVMLGWQINNETLKRIYPGLTSMNPVTCLCLMSMCLIILMLSSQWQRKRKLVVGSLLLALISLIAALVLVRHYTGLEIGVDRWLFAGKLDTPGYPPSKMAPNVAICFLLLSITLALREFKRRWVRAIAQFLLVSAMLRVAMSLLGYAYGFNRLYQIGASVPMALHTALLLLILIAMTFAIHKNWFLTRQLRRLNSIMWIGVMVLALSLTITGVVWRQSRSKLDQAANQEFNQAYERIGGRIDQRLTTYVDTLTGLKSFFAASEEVNRGDFHTYFTSLQLAKRYPGFRAISFVKHVNDSDKQAFINSVRKDNSLPDKTLTNFDIKPTGNRSEYYVATYVEPSLPTTNFGLDLATEPSRIAALRQAQQTGQAVASQTVNFNQTRPELTPVLGFFITMPIYKSGQSIVAPEQIFGMINASFEYETLFRGLLSEDVQKGFSIKLYDEAADRPLFGESGLSGAGKTLKKASTIYAAGRPWRLEVSAHQSSVVKQAEFQATTAVLYSGLVVSMILLALFVTLARSRHRAVILAEDITEDLRYERNQAVAIQQKNQTLLNSIGDAVFAIDKKHRITMFNPSAERISGYSEAEAMDKPYTEILDFRQEETSRLSSDFIKKALSGKMAAMRGHTLLRRKDGRQIQVADSAAPLLDANGSLQGVIVVFRDITKERELEKAKDELVSLVSHQLRTPLAAINWYGEMLLEQDTGKLNKTQKEYLQEIFQGNSRMIELVNALLDVSRLDLGRMSNQPENLKLPDILDSLNKEMAKDLAAKKIKYNATIDQRVQTIRADAKMVRMVLQNLISNAIKYTPAEGQVTVDLAAVNHQGNVLPASHPAEYLRLKVSDTGYGIPADQQSKIFGKLFRADNVQKLGVEGTGLGLYIVKEVVDRLGGRIWFESKENAGTSFYAVWPIRARLPVGKPSGDSTGTAKKPTISSKHLTEDK